MAPCLTIRMVSSAIFVYIISDLRCQWGQITLRITPVIIWVTFSRGLYIVTISADLRQRSQSAARKEMGVIYLNVRWRSRRILRRWGRSIRGRVDLWELWWHYPERLRSNNDNNDATFSTDCFNEEKISKQTPRLTTRPGGVTRKAEAKRPELESFPSRLEIIWLSFMCAIKRFWCAQPPMGS